MEGKHIYRSSWVRSFINIQVCSFQLLVWLLKGWGEICEVFTGEKITDPVVLQILYTVLQTHPGTIYANVTLHGKSVLSMTVCLMLFCWAGFCFSEINRKTGTNPEIFPNWAWIRRAWEQEVHEDRIKDHNLWGRLTHWGDLHPSWFARQSYMMFYVLTVFLTNPVLSCIHTGRFMSFLQIFKEVSCIYLFFLVPNSYLIYFLTLF